MGEVVKDALFLHQPRDEGEVGFAVLDAIFAGLVALLKLHLVLLVRTPLAEDLGDDLVDRLVLEDAAVGEVGEGPQVGHHLDGVVAVLLIHRTDPTGLGLADVGDDAVVGLLLFLPSDCDLRRLPQHRLDRDLRVVQPQVQPDSVETGHLLLNIEIEHLEGLAGDLASVLRGVGFDEGHRFIPSPRCRSSMERHQTHSSR